MPTRSLNVAITSDTRQFKRALGDLEQSTKKTEGRLKGFANVAKGSIAAFAGVEVVKQVVGLGAAMVDTASDIEESLSKNRQLFGRHSKALEKWSESTANSLGVSRKEALSAAGQFGSLFETIGLADRPAASMSKQLVTLAADLASFNNADPSETLEALRSGLSGEAEPMRRFGALLSENRVKQEAWRSGIAKHGEELTEQQKVQARYRLILKDTAVAQGDATKTGGELAGQQRRLGAQISDLGGKIGQKLIPVVRDALDWFNRFLDEIRKGRGAGGEFRRAMERIADSVEKAWPTVRDALRDIREALGTTKDVVVGFVRTTKRVLDGDFKGAWESARETVWNKLGKRDGKSILNILVTLQNPFARAARGLGRSIARGIGDALSSLGDAIKKKVVSEAKKGLEGAVPLLTNPIGALGNKLLDAGDGIGKAAGDGLGFMGGSAGASGAGLRGADFDLGPFARIGASAGLSVTSGLRPGSITSTGNRSYHASGDAIDMGGSMSGMRRAATIIRNLFGSRIRELISPFPELGIKDGRPFRYSAGIQAQHSGSNAHVHVAYTGPFGDGLGRFDSTAYGPPWGGINGTGVTATGVNLKGAPRRYGVAVDPDVIPLGTRLKISPNPFGYGGFFEAFDTGGAIQGNRIDFYDWRGRSSQLRWGTRSVTVSTADGASRGGGGARSRAMSPATRAREAFGRSQDRASMRSRNALKRAGSAPRGPGKGVDRGGGMSPDEFAAAINAVPEAVSDPAAEALAAAIEAQTRATEEHTAALTGVRDEMKRHRQIAESTMATDKFQLYKFVADIMSGQLGRGISNRGLTPGAAVEVAW